MTQAAIPVPADAFQPHIHALRAAAVVLVLLFHLWPDDLPGGYIGVDVFFVISGYLITDHLLREVARRGTISVPGFFARRARRLLPAALTVVAVTAVAVAILMPILRVPRELWHAVASALYFENWALVAQSADYLQLDTQAGPFQHYWTLAVEGQLYVVLPLVLLAAVGIARAAGRSPRLVMGIVLAIVAGASLVYGILLTVAIPAEAYFSTFTRAWEFVAGGLLALVGVRLAGARAVIASWAGFVVLGVAALLYSASTPFPGVAAIPVILAAVLVIASGTPTGRWSPSVLLRLAPVQFLGTISYSLYLWHWPLIVLLPFALARDLTRWDKLALIAVALVLATLSTWFVENPARSVRWLREARPRRSLLAAALATSVTLAVIGAAAVGGQARLERFAANDATPDALTPSLVVASDDHARISRCWSSGDTVELNPCEYPASLRTAPRVALVGDSHAEAISGALHEIAEELDWSLTTYLRQACSWGGGPMGREGAVFARNCTEYRALLAQALEEGDYDAIITTSAVYRHPPVGSVDAFVEVWSPFVEAGVQVIVIADNPRFPFDPVECLIDAADPPQCDIDREVGMPWPDPQLEAAARVPSVAVIDLTSRYCSDVTCFASTGGYVVLRDQDHLTDTFARSLVPELVRQLAAFRLRL